MVSCRAWTNRMFVCTVACLNLKALSLVFDAQYEIISRLTLVCYFVFPYTLQWRWRLCVDICLLLEYMELRHRFGSAQSARTFVLLLCIWTSIKGDYKVMDAVSGVHVIFMCCPKYTTMAMTALYWRFSLIVWHGGIVAVGSVQSACTLVSLLVLAAVHSNALEVVDACMSL